MTTYNLTQLAAAVGADENASKTIRIKITGDDLQFLQQFAKQTRARRLGDALTALVTACRRQSAA